MEPIGSGRLWATKEMFATYLALYFMCIFVRVNEDQILQVSITTCMVMKDELAHTISQLSPERIHSNILILAANA